MVPRSALLAHCAAQKALFGFRQLTKNTHPASARADALRALAGSALALAGSALALAELAQALVRGLHEE